MKTIDWKYTSVGQIVADDFVSGKLCSRNMALISAVMAK